MRGCRAGAAAPAGACVLSCGGKLPGRVEACGGVAPALAELWACLWRAEGGQASVWFCIGLSAPEWGAGLLWPGVRIL